MSRKLRRRRSSRRPRRRSSREPKPNPPSTSPDERVLGAIESSLRVNSLKRSKQGVVVWVRRSKENPNAIRLAYSGVYRGVGIRGESLTYLVGIDRPDPTTIHDMTERRVLREDGKRPTSALMALVRQLSEELLLELEEQGPVSPEELESNPRARALGDRPSMDTGFFGSDLDDEEIDSVSGAEAKDLDAALRRYKTFHAKDPIRVAELRHGLPTRWKPVGDALAVMYRTDKWKKDGNDEDYKHLHDKSDDVPYEVGEGVRIYEPSRSGEPLPVSEPKALTLLGYCLGVFVRKDDDGEIYEANPRACYLFSSPSGDMLAIYSPHKQSNNKSGFLAVLAGGRLRVLKDGIDG